uniref:Uncharacterized protein n=1 Tax=Glossina pallidipes TaxID=7398 RepID=A0A1B0AE10_GLOPL
MPSPSLPLLLNIFYPTTRTLTKFHQFVVEVKKNNKEQQERTDLKLSRTGDDKKSLEYFALKYTQDLFQLFEILTGSCRLSTDFRRLIASRSYSPLLLQKRTNCDTLACVAASLATTTAGVAVKEIEALKQALQEKQNQLLAMETVCIRESERQVELEDSIIAWQDKYDRLYESHKRVQKVNQSLEDKLLKLVDRNSGERAQLTGDVATLSIRLAQANFNIAKLQREIVSRSF